MRQKLEFNFTGSFYEPSENFLECLVTLNSVIYYILSMPFHKEINFMANKFSKFFIFSLLL